MFRQLHGNVASVVTESGTQKGLLLGFNLCSHHLESLSVTLYFVNEVRLDNGTYTGGLGS